jgi:hypothetical protein
MLNAWSLIMIVALCGCASTKAPLHPTQFPMTAKDWHGMDSVEFAKDFRLADYSWLILEPLDTSATKLPSPKENTYRDAVRVEQRSDGIIGHELSRRFANRLAVQPMIQGASLPDRTLLFRGKLLEVDPGSVALRVWVGMGTGLCKVGMDAEIVDAKSGEVLLKFTRYRAGSVNLVGYDESLGHCVEALGDDAGFLLDIFNR